MDAWIALQTKEPNHQRRCLGVSLHQLVLSSSWIGARTLFLFVSIMQPFITISSRM